MLSAMCHISVPGCTLIHEEKQQKENTQAKQEWRNKSWKKALGIWQNSQKEV